MPGEASRRAVATARAWRQGAIDGLDDAMTRRLVASVVLTESHGGDLRVTNRQGYVGRYQAGAGWLADAGYVDAARLREAMARDGYRNEWKWAQSGGMSRFLRDAANWRAGLDLEAYLASADLQDRAFKLNSDAAVRAARRAGRLPADADMRTVAAFLKARHIAGLAGAYRALRGIAGRPDANGTTGLTYFHHILRGTDGLDRLMRTASAAEHAPPAASGRILAPGLRGDDVRQLQARLNAHGIRDARGRPLPLTGNYLQRTRAAVREFQRLHGLAVTGVADDLTRHALARRAELAPGDEGAVVAHLQRVLRQEGHDVDVSGRFDERTEAGVRAFQRARRQRVTGIADTRTLRDAWRLAAAREAAGPRVAATGDGATAPSPSPPRA